MHTSQSAAGYQFPAFFLLLALILLAVSAGCTQSPAPQTAEQRQFVEVTASQPDSGHIVVTYQGGPNMERILELETTVTDSTGKSQTKSAGSRLATTPIPIKGGDTITGNFAGADHVVVVAHMTDGSRTTVLDTTL